MTAGIVMIDLYYNLRRTEFNEDILTQLRVGISNAQFHTLRLFSLKQILYNTHKSYGGIKLHMIEHYPECIALYGPPHVYDMIRYDHLHIEYAKDTFKKTSRRYTACTREMLNKASLFIIQDAIIVHYHSLFNID